MVLVGNVNANHSIINDTLAMKLYSNIKIFSFMVCSFQFIDFVWVFYSLLGFFSDSKMKRKKIASSSTPRFFFHNFPTLCELFHLCNRFGQMPISCAPIPNDMVSQAYIYGFSMNRESQKEMHTSYYSLVFFFRILFLIQCDG